MKEYKFLPLGKYLENSNDALIELTFDDNVSTLRDRLKGKGCKWEIEDKVKGQ